VCYVFVVYFSSFVIVLCACLVSSWPGFSFIAFLLCYIVYFNCLMCSLHISCIGSCCSSIFVFIYFVVVLLLSVVMLLCFCVFMLGPTVPSQIIFFLSEYYAGGRGGLPGRNLFRNF
jgi:hypothetical protein